MSGSVDFKKYETELVKLFKDLKKEDLLEKLFYERKNDEIFNVAANIVRTNAASIIRFKELLETSATETNKNAFNSDKVFNKQPLMCLGATPDTIRIYPNLILDYIDSESLNLCSWILAWDILDTFSANLKADLADDRKKQGWQPLDRATDRLNRYEDIPTARALKRYSGLCDDADNFIRDVAAGIDEQRKPVELIFAEKPEDFVDMYRTGPQSCMSWVSAGAEGRGWAFMPDQVKIHPTSFFAYHPYTKGAYIKFKDTVACRTICYQQEDGKWYYGRIYSTNAKMLSVFENGLKERGITKLSGRFNRKAKFEIDSFQHKQVAAKFMPRPYFDDMESNFLISYDDKTDKFTVDTSKPAKTSNAGTTGGYVTVTQVNIVTCACGSRNSGSSALIQSPDGLHFFCNSACAQRVNYCYAFRSDGTRVYVPTSETFFDKYATRHYTNREACVLQNGYPVLLEIDTDYADTVPEEDDELTVCGHIVLIDDKIYRYVGTTEIISVLAARKDTDRKHIRSKTVKIATGNASAYNIINGKKRSTGPKVEIQKVRTVMLSDKDQFVIAA